MTVTIDNIPVYDAVIEDAECGMFRISLVDDPAVMSNFQAFDREKKQMLYSIEDEEQRKVLGVVMRADFPIYRRDREMGEYYIMYKADTIAQMAEKYLLESRQNDVNLDHQEDKVVDGVQMVQCFIKDTSKGIVPAGFDDIADGSLFAEFHVVNDDVWAEIKAGTYKGFSLEGVFSLSPEQDRESVESIVDSLEGKFSKLFKHKNMSKLQKFLKAMENALVSVACGSMTTDKGVLVWDGDDELAVGMEVFVEDEEGNRNPAGDGEYKTDEKVITVAEGKVESIADAEAQPEAEPEAPVEAAEETPAEEAPSEDAPSESDMEARVKALETIVAQIADWLGMIVINDKGEEMMSADLSKQLGDIKAEMSKISKTPAAAPAHEQFQSAGVTTKTGDRGLDNFARIVRARR